MKLFLLLLTIVVSFTCGLAQEGKPLSEKIITACPFQLTGAARTAEFRFNFLYILDVDSSGKVTKIEELSSAQKYKFVRDDLFLICMKKWRLNPIGKYIVSFNVGTTSIGTAKDLPFNYVRISDPNKQLLTIELWDRQTVE